MIVSLFVVAGANRNEDITRDLFLEEHQGYVKQSAYNLAVPTRVFTRDVDGGSGIQTDSCSYSIDNVSPFTLIASTLDELANDCTVNPDTLYSYAITYSNTDFTVTSQSSLVFADYFGENESVSLNITVECGSNDCTQSSFYLWETNVRVT